MTKIEQSAAKLLMISKFFLAFLHAVTLTFDPLTLNFFGTRVQILYQILLKLNNVTDDLQRCCRSVFLGCNFVTGVGTKLYQIWWRHRTIKGPQQICFSFPICCSLLKLEHRSRLLNLQNNYCAFLTFLRLFYTCTG